MFSPQATFEKLENELREVNQNAEALKKNFLELTELKHILRKTQVFFDEVNDRICFGVSSYSQSQVEPTNLAVKTHIPIMSHPDNSNWKCSFRY